MKTCRHCARTLPLSEFYVHPETSDGYLNSCKECVRERMRRHRRTPAGQASERRAYERKSKNGRLRAQRMVHNAIARGRLTRQPCEVCGDPESHAHHVDYSKPLDVRWLCAEHHGVEHRTRSPR